MNPLALSEVQCFFGILDGLRARGMTVEALETGYVKAAGLRYPLPKRPDGEKPVGLEDDEELTFASAG